MDPDSLLAPVHGDRDLRTPEVSLIPDGWHLIRHGRDLRAGDKYWSPEKLAWLLVTVNSGLRSEQFVAAIRKETR